MAPVLDSFEYFESLGPLLLLLLPALALARHGVIRRLIFIVSGVYLLFLIAPRLVVFHVVFWVVVAAVQPLVHATGERRSGPWVLTMALAVPFVPVIVWKIWPIEFIVHFNVWTNNVVRQLGGTLTAIDMTADLVGPIGLSFSAYRAGDLLIKSNLGLVDRLSPGRILAYGFFAPILIVGPISTYDEVSTTIESHVALDARRALDGALHILSGLLRIWVLVAPLAWSTELFAVADSNPAWRLWIGLFAYSWFFYLNFSGYSALAVGLGRLLGGDIRENFARPYFQTNPTTFWNTWHISLTRFLRANVFTPITAGRPNRRDLATMITLMLVALWHEVTIATVIFGLYHGLSLVLHHQLTLRRPPAANPSVRLRVAKSVALFVWVSVSIPLIVVPTSQAWTFYRALILGGRFA